jgi:hypothetical protein
MCTVRCVTYVSGRSSFYCVSSAATRTSGNLDFRYTPAAIVDLSLKCVYNGDIHGFMDGMHRVQLG